METEFDPGTDTNQRNGLSRCSKSRSLEAEAILPTLAEHAPDALLVVDRAGSIVLALGATREILGHSREELVGCALEMLVPPEARELHPHLRAGFHTAPRSRPMGGESGYLSAVRADGSRVPLSIMLSPFEWEGETLVLCVLRDRSVAEARERELDQMQRSYRELVTSVPVAMYESTVEGRITNSNPTMATLVGYPDEELRGLEVLKLYADPEDRVRFEAQIAPAGRVEELEVPLRRKDGEVRTCLLSATAWADESGRHAGYRGIARDVTDERRAEARIRALIAQQTATVRLGRRALASSRLADTWNEAAKVVAETLNVEFSKVLKHVPEEGVFELVAGVGWTEGVAGSAMIPGSRESQAGYTLYSGDPVVVDDLETETRFRGPALLLEHGVRSGVSCAIMVDGTAWGVLGAHSSHPRTFRRDEVDFVRGVANVIAAAIHRARTEDQLRHAQKVETVGRLAGGIAHDFNNLLTVLTGCAELLLEDLPPASPLEEGCREILQAVEGGTALTRRILGFTRKQESREELRDLREVITDIQPMLRRLIPASVVLETELPEQSVPVQVAFRQVEQVLVNLVVNAVDAIDDEGKVTLKVGVQPLPDRSDRRNEDPGLPYACLEVEDTGRGMPPEILERIGEPFFTTKETGTGLGLSTSLAIVKEHGGSLLAESVAGAGSVLRVFLPLSEQEVDHRPGVADEEVEGRIGDVTLLLVEDDARVRRIMKRMLERFCHQVLVAGHGMEALDILKEHRSAIDIVLTDVVMPGLSGTQLAERLRNEYPALKVIVMSGYSRDELPGDWPSTNHAWLEKPFSVTELRDTIARIVT